MSNFPPPPSASPPPAGGYGAPPPKHPKAVTVLVLGILGLVCCSLIAPFAWIQGKKVHEEIQQSGGAYGGESEANIGKILGIIGTVLLILSIPITIIYIIVVVAAA